MRYFSRVVVILFLSVFSLQMCKKEHQEPGNSRGPEPMRCRIVYVSEYIDVKEEFVDEGSTLTPPVIVERACAYSVFVVE